MLRRFSFIISALLLACGVAPAAAQEPALRPDSIRRLDLPPEIAEALVAFVNDPETIHFAGRSRIPAERTVVGDVAVLGGPFTVAGRIEGRVVVINGDVMLQPGAEVTGDLTVVGGRVSGIEGAVLGGEVMAYSDALRFRRRGERIVYAGRASPGARGQGEERRESGFARSDFLIATGQSYNRVEGLPITFGPVIETASANPLRVRALAIYRSESGLTLDTERLGYYVRAEQFIGGRRAFRAGGTVHSLVAPIEQWHLSDLENGLATFLLRRDYRDHYERKGWSAFAAVEPPGWPMMLSAEARWEDHAALPAGSPWTLFRNAEAWRPQPLIAEGELGSLVLGATLDTRTNAEDPAWGWYIGAELERSFHTDLTRPAAISAASLGLIPPAPIALPAERFGGFTAGRVDIRRYNRVSPDSRLNFRLVAGGSLGGAPLPPQRQHALGGEGSLPGYDLFRFDCAARDELVYRADDLPAIGPVPADRPAAYFPAYGCDRFALFQAEYRGQLGFRLDWGGDPWGDDRESGRDGGRGWDLGWGASPDWVVFVDAGRGWALHRAGTESTAADLGVGFTFSRFGIYAAVPLVGGRGVNVFARLGPRF